MNRNCCSEDLLTRAKVDRIQTGSDLNWIEYLRMRILVIQGNINLRIRLKLPHLNEKVPQEVLLSKKQAIIQYGNI